MYFVLFSLRIAAIEGSIFIITGGKLFSTRSTLANPKF